MSDEPICREVGHITSLCAKCGALIRSPLVHEFTPGDMAIRAMVDQVDFEWHMLQHDLEAS